MVAFRAFIVRENNGNSVGNIEMANTRNLPDGDILIKVKYSSLNYVDALMVKGDKAFPKRSGFTPGIDAAGVIVESSSRFYKKGDEVVVTGGDLGSKNPGGYGQYVRVKESDVISLPIGLSLKDCMTLGTDGLSAALAVAELETSLKSFKKGEAKVVISGASNGVGAFATAILSMLGYDTVALVQNHDADEFIEKLGAKDIVTYEKFCDRSDSPLLPPKFAGAVDCEGGETLSTIVRSLKPSTSVAICGINSSRSFNMSIMPFFMRGINMLGIDGINCSTDIKSKAWYMLAGEWLLKEIPWLCNEISLAEVNEYAGRILKNDIKGRIVVNHDL